MGFYTEAAKQLNNSNSNITPMDAPSFLYECAQTEQALFEGLIELDFAQVYNEAGVISLTEADEKAAQDASDKAIADASKNIFQKFLDALKGIFDKVTAALTDFFNGTKSLVAKKLDNPRAKRCQIKDVWFSDYKDIVVKLENTCKDSVNNIHFGTDVTSEQIDLMRDQVKIMTDLLGNLVDIIPTTKEGVENAENKKAFLKSYNDYRGQLSEIAKSKGSKSVVGDQFTRNCSFILDATKDMYDTLQPKELGGIDMTALTKEISIGGAGSNIKAIFEILKKPDTTVTKHDGTKVKEKTGFTVCITKVRLALFKSYTKGCINTAKIARRNYAVISKFISGKVLNPDENNTNESAAYYGSMSDLFCEQVFGF